MINNSVDFEGIKKKFWANISKIDKLDPGTPERLRLLKENNDLLDLLK